MGVLESPVINAVLIIQQLHIDFMVQAHTQGHTNNMKKECPCKAGKKVVNFEAFNDSVTNANKIDLSIDANTRKRKS